MAEGVFRVGRVTGPQHAYGHGLACTAQSEKLERGDYKRHNLRHSQAENELDLIPAHEFP
jgi:hypothetical protein